MTLDGKIESIECHVCTLGTIRLKNILIVGCASNINLYSCPVVDALTRWKFFRISGHWSGRDRSLGGRLVTNCANSCPYMLWYMMRAWSALLGNSDIITLSYYYTRPRRCFLTAWLEFFLMPTLYISTSGLSTIGTEACRQRLRRLRGK